MRARLSGRLATLGFLALVAIPLSVPAIGSAERQVARLIGGELEARFPRVELQRVDGIVILGGSGDRVEEALQLAEKFPSAEILLSGPGPEEVMIARRSANSHEAVFDYRPKNTYENAQFSREFLARHGGRCWVVVTSALHMPRAVASFRSAGLAVAPWPVFDTPTEPDALSKRVWREFFGLLGYWAVGRTRDLYPVAVPPHVPDRSSASCAPPK